MARSKFQLCAPWTVALIFYSTSTPIQGAGHDYIHMLSETVKPPRTKKLRQRFYAHPGCEKGYDGVAGAYSVLQH